MHELLSERPKKAEAMPLMTVPLGQEILSHPILLGFSQMIGVPMESESVPEMVAMTGGSLEGGIGVAGGGGGGLGGIGGGGEGGKDVEERVTMN